MTPNPRLLAFFQRWLVNTLAVLVATCVVDGIHYDGNWQALIVASLLLGILNVFVRPIIMLLTFPFLLLTLGLFTLVINAALLYFVGSIVKDFHVDNFSAAFWGALVISFVSIAVQWLTGFSATGTRIQTSSNLRTSLRNPPRKNPRDRDDDSNGPVIDV